MSVASSPGTPDSDATNAAERSRTMRPWLNGSITAVTSAAVFGLLSSLGATQGAPQAPAVRQTGAMPRTAGRPDFSGTWQANNPAHWDLQTHEARPIVGQRGVTPNSVVLAAPVVGLGTLGWVPAGVGVVEGEEIPYLPWAAARKK